MDFEELYAKRKKETMFKRMQGKLNSSAEIYLTNKEMQKNRFAGVNSSLFEVHEKSEKWASDSNSCSSDHLTGEEKLDRIVAAKLEVERIERKKEDYDR